MAEPVELPEHSGTVRRPAGRPRSEAVRRAVLDAAYAILVEQGLESFSIEAVSSRAGVARTTIYRWWPSKGALANESFLEAFRPLLVFERSGSAEADFRAWFTSLTQALGGPAGRVAASVVAQAQSEPGTQRIFREEFSEPLRVQSAFLLQAGVDAGQFRTDLAVPRILDAAIGAIYLRLLFGLPLDAAWAAEMAETVLRGCRGKAPA